MRVLNSEVRASRGVPRFATAAGGTLVALAACLMLAVSASAALPESFGEYGEAAGQINEPRGVAVNQETGDVFMVDRNNQRVDEFSGQGEFQRAWGWGVNAASPASVLQTCDEATGCEAGLSGSGAGELDFSEAIAVDASSLPRGLSYGDVYVADSRNNRVEKFAVVGSEAVLVGMFGSHGKSDGQFESPKAIAVDAEGHVYVGDNTRVQRFSEEGVWEETIVTGKGRIEGLATAPTGDIYVLSSGQKGVHEYEPGGKEVAPVRDEAGKPEMALAVDGAGNLFVNDEENPHRILAYDAAGTQQESFDRKSLAEGAKYGLAWSEASGALYLVNRQSGFARIRVVVPPPPGPLVFQEEVTAAPHTHRTAEIQAQIDPESETEPSTYWVDYGTTSALGERSAVQSLAASFAEAAVAVELTGLQYATEYHYCVVAENGQGATPCVQKTFVSRPSTAIEGVWARDVAATSATLEAEVNPEATPTACRFDYDSATLASEIPASAVVAAGEEPVKVRAHLTDLIPGTEYVYRVTCSKKESAAEEAGEQESGAPMRLRTQQGVASAALPDQRVSETVAAGAGEPALVPPQEEGLPVVASDGSAIVFARRAPGGQEAQGNYATVDLASHRDGHWTTTDIATPYTTAPGAFTGKGTEYQLFSSDLTAQIVAPWDRGSLAQGGIAGTPYRRTEAGGQAQYEPLLTPGAVLSGTELTGAEPVSFQGGNQALTSVVFKSSVPLTEGSVPGAIYEWTQRGLANVSVLPGAAETSVGAKLGTEFKSTANARNAVSTNGALVYWRPETGEAVGLYVRDTQSGESLRLDVPQGVTPEGSEPEEPIYQIASSDGTRVFFTDTQRLTPNASATSGAPDLYECEITAPPAGPLACTLSDITAEVLNEGEHADVQGLVAGANEAGSRLYFVATGALQGANAAEAVPGEDNLYTAVEHEGSWKLSWVATLSSEDSVDWGATSGGQSGLRSMPDHTSAEGGWFAFMSDRSLTGYDNRDAVTGEPDEEVFLYDARSGGLACVSCDPTGARPAGVLDDAFHHPAAPIDRQRVWQDRRLAGLLVGWQSVTTNGLLTTYEPQSLTDSGRLFFESAAGLTPAAANGTYGVYEFEPAAVGSCAAGGVGYVSAANGCVSLISPGTAQAEAAFLGAGANGNEAFIMSTAGAAPSGSEAAPPYSIFDVHSCEAGATWSCAASAPVSTAPCDAGSGCKAAAGASVPTAQAPASASLAGSGNVAAKTPSTGKSHAAGKAKRRRELRRAIKRCRKRFGAGKRHRRTSCLRRARKRYGGKAARSSRRHASRGKRGRGDNHHGR